MTSTRQRESERQKTKQNKKKAPLVLSCLNCPEWIISWPQFCRARLYVRTVAAEARATWAGIAPSRYLVKPFPPYTDSLIPTCNAG